MNTVSTEILLTTVASNIGKVVEARLLISEYFCGTHFMYSTGKAFYDEGIAGEKRRTTPEHFAQEYKNCSWILDNII